MSFSASRSSEAVMRSNSRWLNASAIEKARGLTTLPSPIGRSSSPSPDRSACSGRPERRSLRRSAVDSGATAPCGSFAFSRGLPSVGASGAIRATWRRQNWSKTAS